MDYEISFESNKVGYRTDLVEGQGSGPTVCINGKDYTVITKGDDHEMVARILPKIQNHNFSSVGELISRIGSIAECRNVSVVGRSHQIGIQTLSGGEPQKSITGSWMQQEMNTLPALRREVGEKYWDKYIDGADHSAKDHSMLKDAIVVPAPDPGKASIDFDNAIKDINGKSAFCSLFNHLELYQLYPIAASEQLDIELPSVKPGKVDLTVPGLQSDIKTYMRDRGFSGIVALSDGNNDLLVASDEFNDTSTPLSVHSVGKVCTGLLAISLIEKEIIDDSVLNDPIKLDPKIMKFLSDKKPEVYKRLSETKMIDLMLHTSGLKDYLGTYQNDIQNALDLKEAPPVITSSEQLLNFADDDVLEKDKFHYSNLGLLLVGLSLQHHVSQHKSTEVTFEEALNEFVLEPAKIDLFTPTIPENGRFNPDNAMAAHIYGGPGGGHWSTASDLLKIGNWVGKKGNVNQSQDTRFRHLLDQYGGEFYNQGNLWHAGSIPSASAHLAHLEDQQLTIAVLSNTAGFCQATAVAETIQDHLIT